MEAINEKFSKGAGALAQAENAGPVGVPIPADYASRTTEFRAELDI